MNTKLEEGRRQNWSEFGGDAQLGKGHRAESWREGRFREDMITVFKCLKVKPRGQRLQRERELSAH